MFFVFESLLSIVLLSVLYAVWKIAPILYRGLNSPLRRLPGPPSDSFFFGNFNTVAKKENEVLEKYLAKYGDTTSYPDLFGVRCISSICKIRSRYLYSADGYLHWTPGTLI